MRNAMYLAPFGELSDPRVLVEVALAAEESHWDGIFLWDHMWQPPSSVNGMGDAWITLAAIASATRTIRLGPMIVPLARRRPQKVARESVSLDLLSDGRLTVGVGLGVDANGELSRFGEVVDDRVRGDRLDEALLVLRALWSGDLVRHRGEHFSADDVSFIPVSKQRPHIPLWGAAWGGSGNRPIRRASALDGIFPWMTSPVQLQDMLGIVEQERGTLEGYDVAIVARSPAEAQQMRDAGANWLIRSLGPDASARQAITVATAGASSW